ncbi:MAG: hypothetical protein JWO31_94 [Phycisphaerales bacterium]|nr:hypothetical protein [Phycisphaerales bacterium]
MIRPRRPSARAVFAGKAAALALALAVPLAPPSAGPARAADAKEVKLDAAQQSAADALRAKGAAVMQIAADTDALAVNLGILGKQATDAELALVAKLPKVTQLDLHNTAVTDAGLAAVEPLAGLARLHLNGTGVTDAGLAHLAKLADLEYLNLYNTAVTDDGLKQLAGLKKLKRVYLWQTKVTDGGAKALKAAVPEVVVNRGEELVLPPPATKPAEDKTAMAAAKPGDAKPADAKADDKKPAADAKPADAKPTTDAKPAVAAAADAAKPPAKAGKKGGKKPAAAPAVPGIDAEGFVRAWLVAGPIPIEGSAADDLDKPLLADEAALRPKAGDKAKAKDKELTWKPVSAAEFFVDFNAALAADGQTNVAAYAVAYVEAADEVKDVTLFMGSNDQGKVFLNGKELAKFAEPRTLEKDTEKAAGLTLNKGTNVVVLKVINEANNWQGCVRLAGKDGKPPAGVTVKPAP